MAEPTLLGYPVTLLFLYFLSYSFCGWCTETMYCSFRSRHFVPRGFLYGPICPIYGAGVLLMILFFTPLQDNLVAFYFVAVMVMTTWEYFVGWFLETTTHIKYWDYSGAPFNIKGRVCLPISLCWGAMSYLAVFGIHPFVAAVFLAMPLWLRHLLSGISLAALLADTSVTIRDLAQATRLLDKLQMAGDELRVQMALARADLSDDLDAVGETLHKKLETVLLSLPPVAAERLDGLRRNYDELLVKTEIRTRRFRRRYQRMTSKRYRLDDLAAAGARLRKKLRETVKRER